jgi:hypothetical protein
MRGLPARAPTMRATCPLGQGALRMAMRTDDVPGLRQFAVSGRRAQSGPTNLGAVACCRSSPPSSSSSTIALQARPRRERNLFYGMFDVVASPLLRAVGSVAPAALHGRPLAPTTFVLLGVLWLALTGTRIALCRQIGIGGAQPIRRSAGDHWPPAALRARGGRQTRTGAGMDDNSDRPRRHRLAGRNRALRSGVMRNTAKERERC